MKKLIITICTALMLLVFANTITADNIDDSKDPYIELKSASADSISVNCSVSCDTSQVVALVIQILDKDSNLLAMEALEAKNGTSNYRINVPLMAGEVYTVRVANYNTAPYETGGAPWHILEVIAKQQSKDDGGSTTAKYIVPKTGIE